MSFKTLGFALLIAGVALTGTALAQTAPAAPAVATAPASLTTKDIKKQCRGQLKGQFAKGPELKAAVDKCAHADTRWVAAKTAQCETKANDKALTGKKRDKFLSKCAAK